VAVPSPGRQGKDALACDPRPAASAKLAGADDACRIRAGEYSLVYEIAGEVLVVCIVRVAHCRTFPRGCFLTAQSA